MMRCRTLCALSLLILLSASAEAQAPRRDRGVFLEPKNEFLDSIRKETRSFTERKQEPQRRLRVDMSGWEVPASPGDFTQVRHTPPLSQGMSGMCWAFSTISYFESEILRTTRREIKLSELHTVYWEYVEKARRFVRERGNSGFGQGSEANAVTRIWKTYGAVPASAYAGLQPGQKFHDHDRLFEEMRAYLQGVKAAQAWNEETVLATIRSNLNHHLGEPPTTVVVDGERMTAQDYLKKVVRLNPDDYVVFLSLAEHPWYARAVYDVPDNWWRNGDYINIPLDEYMKVLKRAIREGHSLALGGDTSEPGYEGHAGVGIVPSFDIPAGYIDDFARQMRFRNGTSTDDHGVHLVGYRETASGDWYLIKDSGSGSRNNSHPGYMFYHEDYVRLKMLDFMVHRSVAEDVLRKVAP